MAGLAIANQQSQDPRSLRRETTLLAATTWVGRIGGSGLVMAVAANDDLYCKDLWCRKDVGI